MSIHCSAAVPLLLLALLAAPGPTASFMVARPTSTLNHHHDAATKSTAAGAIRFRWSRLLANNDDVVDVEAEGESSFSEKNATATPNNTTTTTAPYATDTSAVAITKEDEIPTVSAVPPASNQESTTEAFSTDKNLSFLQTLGAIAGRGEFATDAQKAAAAKTVQALEERVSGGIPVDKLRGTWELVYCSTQLFRSSPFFMAGRAVCTTEVAAQQYNWFCDMHRKALAISTIRSVRQVISDTKLVSEVEVSAGAVPFLADLTKVLSYSGGWPVTVDGALVSSADIVEVGNGALEITMDTVEIKGSNVPGLRQLLDSGLRLQSRQLADILEQTISSYSTPKPLFRTTYLDDIFRISRDEDDNIFFYVKTSDSTEPADYSSIDSDLGLAKLLAGFNDVVTKIYL